MQYLQVDSAQSMLYVLPERRDWADYREDKHFEYHVATLRMFSGQPFAVEIDAAAIPWSAVLHVALLARVARYARAEHKNQLIRVNVIGASAVAKVIIKMLSPLTPQAVLNKICFVDASEAPKKKT